MGILIFIGFAVVSVLIVTLGCVQEKQLDKIISLLEQQKEK